MTKNALLLLLSLFIAVCIATPCYGEANDVSLSVGAIFSPNSIGGPVNTGVLPPCPSFGCPTGCTDCISPNAATSGVAFAGTLAHRVLNFDIVSLHLALWA
jgi:hypothetical protein